MFDTTHAHESISEEAVWLDRNDAWVHSVYCRHLKPKGSEDIPSIDVARQLIMDLIKIRCINLERLYKSNNRPVKPFQERVQMVIEALNTSPYNGSYL